MIPRTIHQVWVGPNDVPEKCRAWAESFRRVMADGVGWELVLWAEHPERISRGPWEVCELPPVISAHCLDRGRALMTCEKCRHAFVSDVLRLELVAQLGGVYADLDVEVFEDFGSLLEGVDLFTCEEIGQGEFGGVPGNYMFGARANHPVLWNMVRAIPNRIEQLSHEIAGGARKGPINPCSIVGPGYHQQLFDPKRVPGGVVFPWPMFSPLAPHFDGDQVERWPDSAYGNHHFAGTWYKRVKRRPPPPFAPSLVREVMEGVGEVGDG